MNNTINILHLSDLHFGVESTSKVTSTAIAKRNNTLKPLLNCLGNLEQEWRPDIVIISGDIGWSLSRILCKLSKSIYQTAVPRLDMEPLWA